MLSDHENKIISFCVNLPITTSYRLLAYFLNKTADILDLKVYSLEKKHVQIQHTSIAYQLRKYADILAYWHKNL